MKSHHWIAIRLVMVGIAATAFSIFVFWGMLFAHFYYRHEQQRLIREIDYIRNKKYDAFESARQRVDLYYDQFTNNTARGIFDQAVLSNYCAAFQQMEIEYTNALPSK